MEQYLKLESHLDFHHQPQQQQLKQKDMLDLLANYYIKEKKFSLAARILDKLAMKAGLVEWLLLVMIDEVIKMSRLLR